MEVVCLGRLIGTTCFACTISCPTLFELLLSNSPEALVFGFPT